MKRPILAKILYGVLFVIVLPIALVAWAKATSTLISWPMIFSPIAGMAMVTAGTTLVVWSWTALWTEGKGLPMNIAPPTQFVSNGPYRWIPHPIYVGFCMACVGVAIATGSASGLWLVSPCVALGCTALVLGYERLDLRRRFGPGTASKISLLPADSDSLPTATQRVRCYLLVLIPWLILYEACVALGIPKDAISTYLPFEQRMPVLSWTEIVYASTYLWVLFAPWAAASQRSLRKFMVASWVSMALVFPSFLALPLIAEPKPFLASGALGELLAWERTYDGAAAAFPAFHVVWAFIAARVYRERGKSASWAWVSYGLAACIAISCIVTGMHSIADVLGGVVVAAIALRAENVWRWVLHTTETIANSWREWRMGPVRIINHAFYAGAAAFFIVLIAAVLCGPAYLMKVAMTAAAGLAGAGLLAQAIEGSPRLLRPFGFYGGMAGVILGAALVTSVAGGSFWLVTGAFCVGAPWMQAIGRLRCLVQGCCHGSASGPASGIRYNHPRSRVCRLADLRGVPLYPTPLYSIVWNGFVAAAVARLWMAGTPTHFIAGMYLLLSGLGRFAEEAYRGEPQTPVMAGLRLYQWLALITVVAGGLITALGRSQPAPRGNLSSYDVEVALIFAVAAWFALGVDFPESKQRFARLA